MARVPKVPRWYIGAVAGAATLSLAASLRQTAMPGPLDWLLAAQVLALTALARRFPIEVSAKTKLLLDGGPVIAAVLLLPAPLALVSVTAGMVLGELAVGARTPQVLFNSASTVLRTGAGVAVWRLLGGSEAALDSAAMLPAFGAAVATMFLLSTGLVEGMIALTLRRNPVPGLWSRHRIAAATEICLSVAGLAVAGLGAMTLLLLPLLIAPVAIVHLARHSAAPVLAGAGRAR